MPPWAGSPKGHLRSVPGLPVPPPVQYRPSPYWQRNAHTLLHGHNGVHMHVQIDDRQHWGATVPTRPAKRALTQSWLLIPSACSPLGSGLVKITHGSDLTALAVGIAPYTICALLCCLFGIGYLFAAFRYVCTGRSQREFIEIATNAVVSVFTLTPTTSCDHAHRAAPIAPRPRVGDDGEYVSR